MMERDPVFVIAEAGVNHNGSLERALRMVDIAAEAGADAIKFQTFRARLLATRAAPKAAYQVRNTGDEASQYEMLERLELDADAHRALADRAKEHGIVFMSTPFDVDSLRFLVRDMRVSMLKISSGDLTDAQLLLEAARSPCRVILSTGMATLSEVESALAVLAFGFTGSGRPGQGAFRSSYVSEEGRAALRERAVVLQCTTAYPAPPESLNLRAMQTMRDALGVPIGFSDHSEGIEMAVAAVAMGAVMLEKHFTVDRGLPGPDHRASLEPEELVRMVKAVRDVERALGDGRKAPAACELGNVPAARKRMVASRPIRKGEPFTTDNVAPKRATEGASALMYWDIMGRRADRDIGEDEGIE
jgi:N-acetylneuraminate synthase